MKEKILIAGANGHLGHIVVQTALEKGFAVKAADVVNTRLHDIKSQDFEFRANIPV